jgi:hypothetical protein
MHDSIDRRNSATHDGYVLFNAFMKQGAALVQNICTALSRKKKLGLAEDETNVAVRAE